HTDLLAYVLSTSNFLWSDHNDAFLYLISTAMPLSKRWAVYLSEVSHTHTHIQLNAYHTHTAQRLSHTHTHTHTYSSTRITNTHTAQRLSHTHTHNRTSL